jgi:thiosulfate/3-mercaptopyruvate sulfurtransferase
MLDVLGHRRVAVLDGGIRAWVDAGLPLQTEERAVPPARLTLRDRWERTIDRDGLRARLGEVTLLDARAAERYRGEVEPVDLVAGHLPTAVGLPVTGNLAPDERFLPAADLAARYHAVGAGGGEHGGGSGRPTVVYCGSGVNSCHHALAMRRAGLPDPIVYSGSYSDWTRAGLPVLTGPDPGEPPG